MSPSYQGLKLAFNREALTYPLVQAASRGQTQGVERLVDGGATIDHGRGAALRGAIVNGHPDTVQLLLDRGAKTSFGHPFNCELQFARANGHAEIVAILEAHREALEIEKCRSRSPIGRQHVPQDGKRGW